MKKEQEKIVVPEGYKLVLVPEVPGSAVEVAHVPTNAPKQASPVNQVDQTDDGRMTKGKGYLMLILFMGGIVLVWASLANMYLFGAGAACVLGAYWIYHLHLKKGGKSLSQALAENKAQKAK